MGKKNFIVRAAHEIYELLCLAEEGLEHVFQKLAEIILYSAVIMKSGLLVAKGLQSLRRIHHQQKTNDQTSKIVKSLLLVLTIVFSVASIALIATNPVFSVGALMASSLVFLGYHGWRWQHTRQKLFKPNLSDGRKNHLSQKARHRKHLFVHNAGHFLGFSLIFLMSCISLPLGLIFSGVVLFLGTISSVVLIHKIHQQRVAYLLTKEPNSTLIDSLQKNSTNLKSLSERASQDIDQKNRVIREDHQQHKQVSSNTVGASEVETQTKRSSEPREQRKQTERVLKKRVFNNTRSTSDTVSSNSKVEARSKVLAEIERVLPEQQCNESKQKEKEQEKRGFREG